MALYATNRFAGDGVTTSYEFNFVGGYLDRAHVKAYVEGADLVRTPVTLSPGNFIGPYTIGGLAPVPVGSTLVIYRDTPKAPLVNFVNGSRFTEYNLDTATRQGSFIAVEGADAAEAALDSLDDRYLGAKASAPTTDNDGEALLTGALYWDTVLSGMRSWNGSMWVTLPAATKASVGLANVDNTSDANKPISTATQAALNGKQASLGFTPVQQGGATGQGTNKVFIGWATDSSGLLCQVGGTNFGKKWPIDVEGTATTVVNPYASSAVQQGGDIGNAYVHWDTTAAAAVQLDAHNPQAAYMVWRATRWGARHVAAMHVYEGNMTVTMSVGKLNNFIWDGAGNFNADGNVTAYSDIRLKTDLTKITDALSKVSRLNGYTYTRKDTGQRQTGVVAQELQEVLPEAVIDNGEHLSVAYGNIVGLLIEAIKELKSEVDQLKGK